MSRQYFKAEVEFDSNCGPTDKETWYIKENNTTDYREIVRENGEYVTLNGTDSFFKCIALVADFQEKSEGTEKVKIEEFSFFDMPRKVQEIFDYRLCRELYPVNEE